MIPASSLHLFIDPIQDPMNNGTPFSRMYVTEVRYNRNDRILNTVVDIKPGQYDLNEGTSWSITTDGDYVIGAPLNPAAYTSGHIISILPDGEFLYGTVANYGTDWLDLRNLRRSSQQVPVVVPRSDLHDQIRVTSWFAAAPWAALLFPAPEDSPEVVEKKLLVATEKHRQRRIHGIFLRQAGSRDWITNWEELREDRPELPTPNYGAFVSGSIFIRDERTTDVNLEPIRQSVPGAYVQSSGAALSFEMPLPLNGANTDALNAIAHRDVESHIQRSMPQVRGMALMNHSRRPFLRSASN